MLKDNIGALVVLYEPDLLSLKKSLLSLSQQVSLLLFVDNSHCDNSIVKSFFNNAHYITMGGNVGIAAAQNRGIVYLSDYKCDFVFFSDQDSSVPEGYVDSLYGAYEALKDYFDIASIGPIPINKHNKKPYFKSSDVICERTINNRVYYIVDSVMSSCSLTSLQTFLTVGGFEEHLFIDGVDNEWGWRAKALYGKTNIVVSDLSILHELGKYKKVLGFSLNVSTPFRFYYQIRNLIWLSKREYVPIKWKMNKILHMVVKIPLYLVLFSPRLKYLNSITQGIKDGLLGR